VSAKAFKAARSVSITHSRRVKSRALHTEGVLPIDPGSDGLRCLPIRQALDELQDQDQGKLAERRREHPAARP